MALSYNGSPQQGSKERAHAQSTSRIRCRCAASRRGSRVYERRAAAVEPAGGKTFASNPKWVETTVDVFPGMDGPNLKLDADDIRGRNVWNLWVGDSGLMWDYLAQHGFGTADLLKAIDSRRRAHRFAEIGIINQPGFQTAAKPTNGLYLDEPKPGDRGRPDRCEDRRRHVRPLVGRGRSAHLRQSRVHEQSGGAGGSGSVILVRTA